MLMNSHLKFQLRECNKMQMASFFSLIQHNGVKPFMKLHLNSTEFFLIFASKVEWNYYIYEAKVVLNFVVFQFLYALIEKA